MDLQRRKNYFSKDDMQETNRNDGHIADDCSVVKGDRVIWYSDSGPEVGTVKFIGPVNRREGTEIMVGVEFDNPVGKDNYCIGSEFLFSAAPSHGSLLPASFVVKEECCSVEKNTEGVSYHYARRPYKGSSESPLGADLSSLTPFHALAYEQLTSNSIQRPVTMRHTNNVKPSSRGTTSGNHTDGQGWDFLPHMTYSQKGNKENYLGNKGHSKSKVKNGVVKSPHLSSEKKSSGIGDLLSSQPSGITAVAPGIACTKPHGVISGPRHNGGHLDIFAESSPASGTGFSDLEGIDQLTIISDGDETSTPDALVLEDTDLGIGSLVEVVVKEVPRFGVIRWIGTLPGDKKEGRKIAGIEMEELGDGLSDGTLNDVRYFTCAPTKGLFVPLRMCAKDSRFLESLSSNPRSSIAFGSTECQPITGCIPPPMMSEEVRAMFGRNRGIQGHQNSCYLDATLFSMFAFTSVFDNLLFRPPTPRDIGEYDAVQSVLREEIVNPLRANMYVRADRIMKLRTMLDSLSSVRGLTTEEKDPEEFLQSLLAQILKAEPLLHLSSGQVAYHYQLFVEKDDKLHLPSVQTLFDQSFLTSDIKLKEVPSCLIIQMPRFGKDYKMYPRILPSVVLDITDVLEDSPRQCIICGKLAEYECKECYGQCGSGLESIAFCSKCMDKIHSHKKRGSHTSMRKLKVPAEFQMLADHCGTIPRVYMELFAVVCIETSHYVTFTRCGSGTDATWCFFDSMADRKGEQNGYNIPTVTECGDLMHWVGEEGSQMLRSVTDNRSLPSLPRRLLCDAYMCFYQSRKVMMYR